MFSLKSMQIYDKCFRNGTIEAINLFKKKKEKRRMVYVHPVTFITKLMPFQNTVTSVSKKLNIMQVPKPMLYQNGCLWILHCFVLKQ